MRTNLSARRPTELEPGSFPVLEVFILCLAMTINSYTLVSLLPYVGMMVKDILSLETTNEVGFYAGYVASAFTFGRFSSSYVWGQITDSFGRKPVIIIGLLSMAIFSTSFGLSPSYTWAISSRLFLGLTNGTMPALRATLNEVCGPEHLVSGMIYFSGCKALSMILGAGVGGILAQPALHYPNTFSGGLFDRYPFLLPNAVGACFALLVLILTVLFLPETRDYAAASKQRAGSQPLSSDINTSETTETAGTGHAPLEQMPASSLTGTSFNPDGFQPLTASSGMDRSSSEYNNVNGGRDSGGAVSLTANGRGDDDTQDHADEMTAIHGSTSTEEDQENAEPGIFGRDGLLATPHVKVLLVVVCVLQAVQIGLEEAYPLFALSTPDVGGLSWNTVQIGKVYVVAGLLVAVWQLLISPRLVKLIGITTWTRLGGVLSIPSCLAIPAVGMFSWNYSSLFTVSCLANSFFSISTGAMNLALILGSTTLAPSGMRGKLGGLYNMAESFGRLLGPAGFATMYAWSVSPSAFEAYGGWVNHQFVFQVSAAALAACTVLGWRTLTTENLMKKYQDKEEEGDHERHRPDAARAIVRRRSSSSVGIDGSEQQEVGVDRGVSLVSIEVGKVAGREADLV